VLEEHPLCCRLHERAKILDVVPVIAHVGRCDVISCDTLCCDVMWM
jgi:hypothetical protein